jgi:hypothetical protein
MGSSYFGDFFDKLPIYGIRNNPHYVRGAKMRQARRDKGVAGSYNHIVTDHGNLVSNETFVGMIENLGDAYEMTEEMYGMIWFLACNDTSQMTPAEAVETARKNYDVGLTMAKAVKDKVKPK